MIRQKEGGVQYTRGSKNPQNSSQNRKVAVAKLISLEKRLQKNQEYREVYACQIQDMLDRKAARLVTQQEFENYQDPLIILLIMQFSNRNPNPLHAELCLIVKHNTWASRSMNVLPKARLYSIFYSWSFCDFVKKGWPLSATLARCTTQ